VIVVAGEALVDLVPGADGALRPHPGGGPFNTARTLARLDRPVAFLGRLSTDRFGRRMEDMLRADGVALNAVVHTDEPTTLALAEVYDAGAARYRFYERGTSAPGLRPADALAALPAEVEVLHVGTLGIHLEPVADAIEALVQRLAQNALIAVDPNVRPGVLADPAAFRGRLARLLERADVLKLSEDDLAWLAPASRPEAGLRALLGGARVGVLTRGGDGALVVTRTHAVDVPAPRVDVVDTIGAGDAFGGGLVAWWHMGGHGREELGDADAVAEAARFACQVAALTCARAGATPPTLAEVRSATAAGRGARTP
jgi:fructokinase